MDIHLPTAFWIVTAVASALLAAVVVLARAVYKADRARPEEVKAEAAQADHAIGQRVDGLKEITDRFGKKLDDHAHEARETAGKMMAELGGVREGVAVIRTKLEGVTARVEEHDEEYRVLHAEVSANREQLAVHNHELDHIRRVADEDRLTPLPQPMPVMPMIPPRLRQTRPPAPRAPGQSPVAPGARPRRKAAGLPPEE